MCKGSRSVRPRYVPTKLPPDAEYLYKTTTSVYGDTQTQQIVDCKCFSSSTPTLTSSGMFCSSFLCLVEYVCHAVPICILKYYNYLIKVKAFPWWWELTKLFHVRGIEFDHIKQIPLESNWKGSLCLESIDA